MIKEFFNKIHPINDNILDEYLAHWSAYELPRKTLMTSAGDTERYLYFVLEGIQKSYFLHDAKYHIIAFAYAPSFSGIPESFLTQTPSRYFLETISKSRFLRISFAKHQQLIEKHRPIETFFRKATEWFLEGVIQRQHELMALSIEERFRIFVERSPHLLQMVPQKDLASYLRIDASNFSKLINKIKI